MKRLLSLIIIVSIFQVLLPAIDDPQSDNSNKPAVLSEEAKQKALTKHGQEKSFEERYEAYSAETADASSTDSLDRAADDSEPFNFSSTIQSIESERKKFQEVQQFFALSSQSPESIAAAQTAAIEQKISELLPTDTSEPTLLRAYFNATQIHNEATFLMEEKTIEYNASLKEARLQKEVTSILTDIAEALADQTAANRVIEIIEEQLKISPFFENIDYSQISIKDILELKYSLISKDAEVTQALSECYKAMDVPKKLISEDKATLESISYSLNPFAESKKSIKRRIAEKKERLSEQKREKENLLKKKFSILKQLREIEAIENGCVFQTAATGKVKEYKAMSQRNSSALNTEIASSKDSNYIAISTKKFFSALWKEILLEDESFTIREELLDKSSPLKDKELIYQTAYNRFLEYLKNDTGTHPGHADNRYSTLKKFYIESRKLYEENEYNLAKAQSKICELNKKIYSSKDLSEKQLLEKEFLSATIDFTYLMSYKNHVLENLAFYEHCLEHNLKIRNDYVTKSKKKAGRILFATFILGSAGKTMHGQLKADGEERERRFKEGPTGYEFETEFDTSHKERERASLENYLASVILSAKEQQRENAYKQYFYQNAFQSSLPQATLIYPYPMYDIQKTETLASAAGASTIALDQASLLTMPSDLFQHNFIESYAEYFIRNTVNNNPILSQADFYKNRQTLLLLTGNSQTTIGSAAWNEALRGMWSQTCNTAAGVTLGTAIIVPVHIAAHLAITTFIPQFALPFKLGQTLYGLYNNSDALVRDIAGLYNALSKGEYFEFGESLIATGYDAVVVRNGSKILYQDAQHAYKQGNFKGWSSAFAAGARNANKTSTALASEATRQQKIKARFGNNVPNFIAKNGIPNVSETILSSGQFTKTKYRYDEAAIYKGNNGLYYYIDKFHFGLAAHLEVFDKTGKIHLGSADVITGKLIPGSAKSNRNIKV